MAAAGRVALPGFPCLPCAQGLGRCAPLGISRNSESRSSWGHRVPLPASTRPTAAGRAGRGAAAAAAAAEEAAAAAASCPSREFLFWTRTLDGARGAPWCGNGAEGGASRWPRLRKQRRVRRALWLSRPGRRRGTNRRTIGGRHPTVIPRP